MYVYELQVKIIFTFLNIFLLLRSVDKASKMGTLILCDTSFVNNTRHNTVFSFLFANKNYIRPRMTNIVAISQAHVRRYQKK